MDAQIWYAIYTTIYGGVHGAYKRLGEVGEVYILFMNFSVYQIAILYCLGNHALLTITR